MIFHIIWKEDSKQLFSTGANFEGETAKDAVELWEQKFPKMYFFGMYIQEEPPFQFHKKETNMVLPSIKRPKRTTKNFLKETFSFTKNNEDGN